MIVDATIMSMKEENLQPTFARFSRFSLRSFPYSCLLHCTPFLSSQKFSTRVCDGETFSCVLSRGLCGSTCLRNSLVRLFSSSECSISLVVQCRRLHNERTIVSCKEVQFELSQLLLKLPITIVLNL